MPLSLKGKKTCSSPRDCSARTAHTRNSNTCPEGLASPRVHMYFMRRDSRPAVGAYPSRMATEEIGAGVYRIDAHSISNGTNVLAISNADGWTLIDTGTTGGPKR